MRRLKFLTPLFGTLFLLALVTPVPQAAQAALLKLDITYTNGQILSGPLSADLTELPTSVLASFTLTGSTAGDYNLEDVLQASLAFGDGAWSVGDLQSFATTLLSTDSGGLAVTSLTYAFAPIDTPAVSGRLAANFPLEIQGTDLASGEAFHYRYDTSTQTVTVVRLDHFMCYKAKSTPGTPKFTPQTVTLADQFESGNAQVKKVKSLCNPADKNDEGINDPDTHLKGYQIKPETAHVPRTNIQVDNQFGTIFVDTIKPDRLLVPTAKSLTGPVEPLDPVNIDHFKCYKVKVTPGTAKFEPILGVSVDDQFTDGAKLFDLSKPTRLCNPVEKTHDGTVTPKKNPAAHLMCYKVKPGTAHTPVAGIHTNNQFGPERLDTIKEEELCVPSEKILP